MIPALWQRLNGSSLMARALRSSMLTVGGFGAAQVMRLASNLILTRLLFPEAFGLMALVSVFMMGLQQFSDVGVTPAILQSRRGDERDFLNTAWTIQAVRGAGLWLLACALAWPAVALFLRRFTDTDVPWWDGFATGLSLVGQFLLGRKFIENWVVWLAVNLVSIGLFVRKGLWLTVGLYAVFAALSVAGYLAWRQRLPRAAGA